VIKKDSQIGNVQSDSYQIVKISPVDPEISLLKGSLKKKVTQSKHIVCTAGTPHGLNKKK